MMITRIAVCCPGPLEAAFAAGIRSYSAACGRTIRAAYYPAHHDFLGALHDDSLWDGLIVAEPGARGMETVISVRELAPETPLIWCSDDADFAVTSYRLHCSLFLPMPLTENEIAEAIARCMASVPLKDNSTDKGDRS